MEPLVKFILIKLLFYGSVYCSDYSSWELFPYLNSYTVFWPSAHTPHACNKRGWNIPPLLYYTVKTEKVKIVVSFHRFSLMHFRDFDYVLCVFIWYLGKIVDWFFFWSCFMYPVVLRFVQNCKTAYFGNADANYQRVKVKN